MKFTKEEIILCKQIAEKHRKQIGYGDWFCGTFREDFEIWTQESESAQINSFPLWTITDCLEFFNKREYTFERSYQLGGIFTVHFISEKGTIKGGGDTLLIACLKAVLAVCGEKSNG